MKFSWIIGLASQKAAEISQFCPGGDSSSHEKQENLHLPQYLDAKQRVSKTSGAVNFDSLTATLAKLLT